MNPFDLLKTWREKRVVRRAFSSVVSPDVLELMESGAHILPPEERDVEFIIVRVRDDDARSACAIIARVVDSKELQKQAFIGDIVSNIVFLAINVPRKFSDSTMSRQELVNWLLQQHGSDIALVHGTRKCLVGNIGGNTRMSYQAMLPNVLSILARLSKVQYGSDQEI
jgi:hypothetical protein